METIAADTFSPSLSSLDFVWLLFVYSNLVVELKNFYSGLLFSIRNKLESLSTLKALEERNISKLETKIRRSNSKFCSTNITPHVEDIEIEAEDIDTVMERLGLTRHAKERETHFSERIERMGREEFSNLFEEQEPSSEELKEAFAMFDENRDGFISPSELQKVLSKLGFDEGTKLEDCKNMIKAFDENGDGKIDFQEFESFMESSFS
ncbi:probable calcium-binding protein CML30 [Amborella trichopoda]|uniref:EF-hand domain-containing protein n=1 Tax=Amborella trichopoda TaxID=13333 RepID=W1NH42_AMBTC|nr:probable calcium-binding protein CML30 [Amborella trichopoda]ERM94524.1 hypothetical protein AMTR_s00010p00264300 [Amborella trichopoda]|eukprot:XP_006827287.1 probable calcium-binding protein CML30 [Amborella trichopoda]